VDKFSRAELVAELKAAGARFKGKTLHCLYPENHRNGDKTPSAGIYQGKDGVCRWHCMSCGAGGDIFDVRAMRTGQPLSEILKNNSQDAPRMTNTKQPAHKDAPFVVQTLDELDAYMGKKFQAVFEMEFTYSDTFSIRRYKTPGDKEFRPVQKTDKGYLVEFPDYRPLYHSDGLQQAQTVIITEGEKKADILAGFGFIVTTSSAGGKSAAKTDWTPLAGKPCIIWPDNDTAGKQYAQEVREILAAQNCRIKIVNPGNLDLAEKEDCADYIQQLKNAGFDDFQIKQNLIDIFNRAQAVGGAGQEVQQHITGIAQGKYIPIETGFRCLDDLVQILPGTVNLICGSPGSSKSLWMLQLAAVWHKAGIRTSVFELEKDRVFHLRRALAQESGQAMLTNNRWVMSNPQLAQQIAAEHLDFMDGFGRMVDAMPEKIIHQKDVIDWAKHKADTGSKVLIIDPATKAERQDEPYKADGQFVTALQQIATLSGAVIFLVLHPAKNIITSPDLSLIAGGAAYSRFADNAVWLESHEPKKSYIKTPCGTIEEDHDRTLWILKSRDGGGTNSRIAFNFDKGNLSLKEIGQTIKKNK